MFTIHAHKLPATLREKSSWTPKNHPPSNEKIFVERMSLIKKWYRSWSEQQRWVLTEYILRHLSDSQLTIIHDLLHPVMPSPDHDFTRVLPRHLCIRILSYLDPQSLCRASQVCWYWKYLAECHALWQPKCLRLGWFLPTPPSQYDCSAWKRHYVACVCQLHWSPPQPPDDPDNEETLTADQTSPQQTFPSRTRRRRTATTRHSMHHGEKRPWRDPDVHPKDTHFKYTDLESGISRFLQCRPKSREEPCDHNGYHPLSNETVGNSPLIEPDPSPPSALMHPTLLEKLRLGAPSSGHIQLSTINRSQSQHAVVEEFYRLQDSSPFPKLPPYFIHSTNDKLSVKEPSEREDIHNSSSHMNGTTHRSRPELTSKHKATKCERSTTEGQQLLLHPWKIPSGTPDSEED